MKTLRQAAEQALEALKAYGTHTANCDHLMLLTSLPPQRKPCSCGLVASIIGMQEALAEEEHITEKTIKGECSVELIRENEDGSADYAFNFPPEAMQALTRLGILTAIKAGIEDAKRLNPEEYDDRQD